ncbi:hypothetical protein F511_12262 [Dorcoceras hygrometricum]|uniref:Uncharacterized protein n=1 Tax=Dorcoceras hygrometricum TaxID=472368 RepID=A0A2Z7D898_9LAMI|nr:hypothetical protein F511_12262 [Dorcoceras hygrometricum]
MVGLVRTAWTWGWSSRKGSCIGGRRMENECEDQQVVATAQHGWSVHLKRPVIPEHAEPLGSLGLNGAGDDPVDEYIPTGGEDL